MWVFSGVVVILNAAIYLFRPGGDLLLTVVSDSLPAVCALAAVLALASTFRALAVFDQTKRPGFSCSWGSACSSSPKPSTDSRRCS